MKVKFTLTNKRITTSCCRFLTLFSNPTKHNDKCCESTKLPADILLSASIVSLSFSKTSVNVQGDLFLISAMLWSRSARSFSSALNSMSLECENYNLYFSESPVLLICLHTFIDCS